MYREPTLKGRKLGLKGVDQKEERNIQPKKNEETIIQKNEKSIRNVPSSKLQWYQKEKRKSNKLKTFLNK